MNPVHDADGNLLTDGRYRYQWDAENRLIAAIAHDPGAPHRIEYGYDHQNRRVLRREYNATEGGALTCETAFLYDDWNLLTEVPLLPADSKRPAPSPKLHTWGRDLSGSLQGAGGVGGLLAISTVPQAAEGSAENRKPKSDNIPTVYFCYDANGNVTQLVDGVGELKAQYEYDAFGKAVVMTGKQALENSWRFSTKPEDVATGMLYYGYRWYDGVSGRWVSRDPLENQSDELNPYAITMNRMGNEVDPQGLESWSFTGKGEFFVDVEGSDTILGGDSYERSDAKVKVSNLKLWDRDDWKRDDPLSSESAFFRYSGDVELDTDALGNASCYEGPPEVSVTNSVYKSGAKRCKQACEVVKNYQDLPKRLKESIKEEFAKELVNRGFGLRLCGNKDSNCPRRQLAHGWGGTWKGDVSFREPQPVRDFMKIRKRDDKCECTVTVSEFTVWGRVNED